MEEFILSIHAEVKKDPLITLNLVMSIFTIISLCRLMHDLYMSLCRSESVTSPNNEVLEAIEILRTILIERKNDFTETLANLRAIQERLDSYSGDVTVNNETNSSDSGSQEELLPIEDKHSQLIKALNDGETVNMFYKKQTFTANFVLKSESQHGYVLKSDNDTEYNTPSHFSHAKKLTINNKIRSDNGWQSVYVIRENKKLTLNDLINSL
jgi:hypothetical protein